MPTTPGTFAVGEKTTAAKLNTHAAAITEVQAGLLLPPFIDFQASGTAQSIASGGVVNVTGNGSGWAAVNNAGGTALSLTAGVGATPVTFNEVGLYFAQFRHAHSNVAANTASTELYLSNGQSDVFHFGWYNDNASSGLAMIRITVAGTKMGARLYNNATTGTVSSFRIDVQKFY